MTLIEQRNKWKEELLKGISPTLEGIGSLLNKKSDNFDMFIQLSSRNRKNVQDQTSGIVDVDTFRTEENRIRQSVLELINNIQEKDLAIITATNDIEEELNIGKIKAWLESKISTLYFNINYREIEKNGLVRKWDVEYINYRIAHDKTDLILVYVQKIKITRNDSKERVNEIILENRVVIPLEKLSSMVRSKQRSKDYFLADKHSKEYINYLEFSTLYSQKAIKIEEYRLSEIFEEKKLIERDNKKTDKYINDFWLILPDESISQKLERAFTELKNRIVSDELY